VIPANGFYEWVRREVACVIVRRHHPAEPAVPSAVSYEVGRFGNESVQKPSDNVSLRRKTGVRSARKGRFCQHRGGAGLGWMAWSVKANFRTYRQETKAASEMRSARMLHSHPSWARDRRYSRKDLTQSCHTCGTR
jgi:hypothetical protein